MNAIVKYINWHYITINAFLRGETSSLNEAEIIESIKLSSEMNTYFDKNSTKKTEVFRVYRGITLPHSFKKRSYEPFVGYQKGFTSTGLDEYFVFSSYCSEKLFILILDIQPGVPHLFINDIITQTGIHYDQEDEVLFPPGVILTVKKVLGRNDPDNPYTILNLQAIYCDVTYTKSKL